MNVYGIQWIKGGRTIEAPAGYNLHDFFRSSIPDEITAPWWDANYLGADADGVGLLWDDSPARLGRLGGAAKSARKSSAARENGKKGGRPKGFARNTTTEIRWTLVQVGPKKKVLGHYSTQARAEEARERYLSQPWGSGVGPIVQIHQMAPGEYLVG